MTPAEFATTEALNFNSGDIVVVSGADLAKIYIMMLNARDTIRGAGRGCKDPIDTRALTTYPSDIQGRAFQFEFERLDNISTNVILVGNQFDRKNLFTNPNPVTIEIDTVIDILNERNIFATPSTADARYGTARELFSFLSRLYFYDTYTDEVTFIKTQTPERP